MSRSFSDLIHLKTDIMPTLICGVSALLYCAFSLYHLYTPFDLTFICQEPLLSTSLYITFVSGFWMHERQLAPRSPRPTTPQEMNTYYFLYVLSSMGVCLAFFPMMVYHIGQCSLARLSPDQIILLTVRYWSSVLFFGGLAYWSRKRALEIKDKRRIERLERDRVSSCPPPPLPITCTQDALTQNSGFWERIEMSQERLSEVSQKVRHAYLDRRSQISEDLNHSEVMSYFMPPLVLNTANIISPHELKERVSPVESQLKPSPRSRYAVERPNIPVGLYRPSEGVIPLPASQSMSQPTPPSSAEFSLQSFEYRRVSRSIDMDDTHTLDPAEEDERYSEDRACLEDQQDPLWDTLSCDPLYFPPTHFTPYPCKALSSPPSQAIHPLSGETITDEPEEIEQRLFYSEPSSDDSTDPSIDHSSESTSAQDLTHADFVSPPWMRPK